MKKVLLTLLVIAMCHIPNFAIAQQIRVISPGDNFSDDFANGAQPLPPHNIFIWRCFIVVGLPNERVEISFKATNNASFHIGASSNGNCATWSDLTTKGVGFAGGGRSKTIDLAISPNGAMAFYIYGPPQGSNRRFEIDVKSLSNPRPPVQILPAPSGTASTINAAIPNNVAAGTKIKDCDQCPEMVVLPAGEFMMGSPTTELGRDANEGPRHKVIFARPFAISATEVTFDQWDACVAESACKYRYDFSIGRGKRPVFYVNYSDALSYAGWLSQKTGQHYFLPSESEWEYAARGGSSDTPWHTGDAILAEDANILNQFNKVVPTGSYPPNGFGLYDIHGNVAEWTQDCLDTGYLGVPTNGRAANNAKCDTQRIVRGGSYIMDANGVRLAKRRYFPISTSGGNIGFRVTRAIK